MRVVRREGGEVGSRSARDSRFGAVVAVVVVAGTVVAPPVLLVVRVVDEDVTLETTLLAQLRSDGEGGLPVVGCEVRVDSPEGRTVLRRASRGNELVIAQSNLQSRDSRWLGGHLSHIGRT